MSENIEEKIKDRPGEFFWVSILAVLAIFTVYVVGFMIPLILTHFFQGTFETVYRIFFSAYSFIGVALISSLVFLKWIKKNSDHAHVVMLYLFLGLTIITTVVDFRALLSGFENIFMVTFSYVLLANLLYAIFNYFKEGLVLSLVGASVILGVLLFYV